LGPAHQRVVKLTRLIFFCQGIWGDHDDHDSQLPNWLRIHCRLRWPPEIWWIAFSQRRKWSLRTVINSLFFVWCLLFCGMGYSSLAPDGHLGTS
jgi:hypothetical protein